MGMEQGGYTTDAGGGDQGSYDYGGGDDFNLSMGAGGDEYGPGVDLAPIDWGFDTTQWPTLSEGSDFGGGYLPGLDPSSGFIDLGDGFVYDVNTGGVLDTGLQQGGSGFDDVWRTEYEGWRAFGTDEATAAAMADQALEAARAAEGAINISQSATELDKPPELPDVSFPFYGLPYVPDPFLTPYTPIFPDLPVPPPPVQPLPPSPATQQPNLPPACPGGQYHPYPIGHPQQNVCIPFPPAQTGSRPQQQQRPAAPSPAPRPPAQQQQKPQQQQCPQGYHPDPVTRQCKPVPKCVTPGTVFDQRTGRCVPTNQAQAPACPSGQWFNPQTQRCEPIPACQPGYVFDPNRGLCVLASELSEGGMLDELGKLPWWIWAALGGLFLLSQSEERKTTTIQHKRAT